MKRTNSMVSLTISAILSLALMACGNGKSNNQEAEKNEHDHSKMEHSSEHNTPEGTNIDMTENESVTVLIDHYLSVKNALVQDDAKAASMAGQKLAESASAFNLSTVDESKQNEVTEMLNGIKEHGEHIAKSEMDGQREHLEEMSNDLSDLLKITGTDRTLYQQYCPMYKNNEGGYWISDSKEIRNPLFGSKMLKCGKVTKEM